MQKSVCVFTVLHLYYYISIYKTLKINNTGEKIMDQAFIEKMKKELLNQRKTILESLAGQSDDMRELVKTVESGDEADVAADAIDRTLLTALGSQDAKRLQQIDNCLDRI